MKLYIANKNYSSWSLRPWVLMRMLDIAFDEELVPFGGGPAGVGFHAFSPTGKVPCLVDGDTVVWDSLSITEYLAERVPAVWPADPRARAWARSAAAEMHSGFATVRNLCTMNCGLRIRLSSTPADLLAEWARIDALWCEGLRRSGGPFLAGDRFTAVDAFFAPVAFRVQTYTPALSDAARAYAERLLQLAPMRDWYEAALREPWRDEAHELEAHQVGTVLTDLRIA
ncbi:MAG TPA: glutathione S-transferase family protein [Quisquiliibacterium sp.]|nr:glutathione S-transferase family protein [Quisquiliibacterium sp.]HPA88488.1 glutathione S-transferase family protein [Quisquiliibacterium sp.]HQD85174.1 glutathione S-transferase family protein [Quisquiliibacterium sp.]HQN10577.1 glutathione S-transferase family protein [Quisquiliibacterium sp.]HQP65777.1 glutathione S-transferase family protein [Quisquiliibacterium sp.]